MFDSLLLFAGMFVLQNVANPQQILLENGLSPFNAAQAQHFPEKPSQPAGLANK
ncbi:hypothetical protein QWJ34_01030 [Saccharibacillus sp. CPCC 101409]|uniref:hypothetical protein n=1 Tax=Saccharibacillus sp. CPCC 101409 TaxID=3058041 RepID=UPI0026740B86|nr:hypothetical protein [Saccharibacillus sp. CPCC 101409]MDO3408343.1 hypothetical protein [Saccharibacillus sp. CPCC 101409]